MLHTDRHNRPVGNHGLLQTIPTITDQEFERFKRLIRQETGIYLPAAKKGLLVGRLASRLRALSLQSFSEYYSLVVQEIEDEKTRFIDLICTNQTRFFRESRQLQFLEQVVVNEWEAQAAAGSRDKRLRVWCAACSTGEEPFTVAMILAYHLRLSQGWKIQVIGSDISSRALAVAESAMWPVSRSQDIPEHYLKAFMLKGTNSHSGKMTVAPDLRAIVEFRKINLNDSTYRIEGLFDLVLCRNVMIYFESRTRLEIAERILNHIGTGGYLFLGHAETLQGFSVPVTPVAPSIYMKSDTKPSR